MRFPRVLYVLVVLLVAAPAAADWHLSFDDSPASGVRLCMLLRPDGLIVSLRDDPEKGRSEIVMVAGLRYGERAYLAWGEERYATEPARPGGSAPFPPDKWPDLIQRLKTEEPPAYDWQSTRSRRQGEALKIKGFAAKYRECRERMGWEQEKPAEGG